MEARKIFLAISLYILVLICGQTLGNPNPEPVKFHIESVIINHTSNRDGGYPTTVKVPGTDIVIQTIHYYKIGVRRYQNFGFLTWTNEEVSNGGGNYIQLALDPTYKSEFEKGGQWYEHTHWTFQTSEVDGFVTIRLKTFPNTFLAVIFDPKTDTNHLVLLADDNLEDFSAKGSKRSDALFQLIPSETPGYIIGSKSNPTHWLPLPIRTSSMAATPTTLK